MKTLRPGNTGFAMMHTKTIIVDDAILVTGSLNLTHNGIQNSVEEIVVIVDPAVVRQRKATIERHWIDERTQEVDMDMIRRISVTPPMYRRSSSNTAPPGSAREEEPAEPADATQAETVGTGS